MKIEKLISIVYRSPQLFDTELRRALAYATHVFDSNYVFLLTELVVLSKNNGIDQA